MLGDGTIRTDHAATIDDDAQRVSQIQPRSDGCGGIDIDAKLDRSTTPPKFHEMIQTPAGPMAALSGSGSSVAAWSNESPAPR
jgi:hypothetical protein